MSSTGQPDIRTIPKGVTDVVLGALAFFAGTDRSALPMPYLVAVLPFYLITWAFLVTIVLFIPEIIGGSSPAERFAELGPVIVLSIPILWMALERLQVALHLYDAIVGISALLHKRFQALHGLDGPLSPCIMTGSMQIVHSTVDLRPHADTYYDLRQLYSSGTSVTRMEPVNNYSTNPSLDESGHFNEDHYFAWFKPLLTASHDADLVAATYVDVSSISWRSEILPIVGKFNIAPVQLTVETKFDNIVSNVSMSSSSAKTSSHLRKVIDRLIERYTLLSKHISRRFKKWTKSTIYGASIDSSIAVDNNLTNRWQITSEMTWLARGLVIRRGAMQMLEIFVSSFQSLFLILTSFFDYVVTRICLLGWVFIWEIIHPLKLRREHAVQVLKGAFTLVCDRPKFHYDLLLRYGRDNYLVLLAGIYMVRIFNTVLQGSEKLLVEAIVMCFTGVNWRVQKHGGQVEDYLSMCSNLGFEQLLPLDIGSKFEFLVSNFNLVGEDEESISVDSQADLLTTVRKQDYDMSQEKMSGLPITESIRAGIVWNNAIVPYSWRELASMNVNRGSWIKSIRIPDLQNEFNEWRNAGWSDDVEETLKEMENIALDCHYSARDSIWTEITMNHVKPFTIFRNKEHQRVMTRKIRRSDAHDLLVALHRNVIASTLCLFIDDYASGNHEPWYKWCVIEACHLRDLVEQEIQTTM